jgi:ribonuclease III
MAELHDMKGNPGTSLIELLSLQEPDINRIIPVFVSRFNAVYGDPHAERWDITKEDWQRYEFLGDSVLRLIIAQTLFVQRDAVLNPGEMTKILADVVSNKSLDVLSRNHDAFTLLIPRSIGEQNCYGEKITAGAFEAFIGALYCEVGLDDVSCFVNEVLADALANYNPLNNTIGILQEYFQKKGDVIPIYAETGRAGPGHKLLFSVRVTLADGRSFEGTGPSLSEAKKAAARIALEQIEQSS